MITVTNEVSTCTRVEGIPTFRIVLTLGQSGISENEKGISLFHLRLMNIPANRNCPITVAMAAPLVPKPNVKMKIGSRIRFVIEAADRVKRNR